MPLLVVNICVNKCSFTQYFFLVSSHSLSVHTYAITVDVLSVCTDIREARRIVIEIFRIGKHT
jgi:hypothetical protein